MARDSSAAKPIGRRMFLGLGGVGLATLLVGHGLGQGSSASDLTSSAGVASDSLFSDLVGQGGFRIYTVAPIPKFDPASWRMTIGGLVDKPLELTYAQLLALPSTIAHTVFHCVTGWSVPNLTWRGVTFQTIVDMVRPHADARALIFSSSDGAYTDSLTVDQAMAPNVLLAYHMNEKPLPLDQGLPVRLLVPRMYGYKSVKWVNKIDFAPRPISGYWEVRGYDVDAYIGRSNSFAF